MQTPSLSIVSDVADAVEAVETAEDIQDMWNEIRGNSNTKEKSGARSRNRG